MPIIPHHHAYDYLNAYAGVDPVTRSAEVVVPLILERFAPKSVLDFGCGTGTWLSVFAGRGVADVQGYDGPWVPREKLRIPPARFEAVDFPRVMPPVRRFDLAISVEVAEHLPAEAAGRLVDFLCASADVVLWSAAIPGQGGHGHINERPQGYWIEEFHRRQFEAFDLIRPVIWNDETVSVWYRQNLLVFGNATARARYGLVVQPFIASVVHPELFERDRDPRNYSLRAIFRHLPYYLRQRLRRSRGD